MKTRRALVATLIMVAAATGCTEPKYDFEPEVRQ